nr:IclR family transcriptional regulator C-terminal domain-containing protein [Rhodococcus sp. 06-418-1B]
MNQAFRVGREDQPRPTRARRRSPVDALRHKNHDIGGRETMGSPELWSRYVERAWESYLRYGVTAALEKDETGSGATTKLTYLVLDKSTSPQSPIDDVSVKDLSAVVEDTEARGWSQDIREFDESNCCCGAAVFDHAGAVIAAISRAGVDE